MNLVANVKFFARVLIAVEIVLTGVVLGLIWFSQKADLPIAITETLIVSGFTGANLAIILTLLTRMRKLESAIKMCAWTKKIQIDGKWITLEEFMNQELGLRITYGITEEAAAQVQKSMKRTRRKRSAETALIAILSALITILPTHSATTPEDEPVVQAVQQVIPAVVNIYTERIVEQTVQDPMDEFYEQFFGGGFSRGTRILRTPVRNLGSGLLLSPEGYIITCYHVVERAAEAKIKVTLHDGTDFDAIPISQDEDLDLAVIQIKRKELFPFLNLTTISPNLLGQTVIAIGNPIGYESSVSRGILSAKNRAFAVGNISYEGLLQTDAAINPGNSGGPLVDIQGKLVGINTAKMGMAKNITIENIGFAIPAERVKAFAENAIAIAKGEKPPPLEQPLTQTLQTKFGLQIQTLTPQLAQAFDYQNVQGLIITNVEPQSPAHLAGLEKGMLIVAIGNIRVRTEADLPRQLTRVKPGNPVPFTLILVARRGTFTFQRAVPVLLEAR